MYEVKWMHDAYNTDFNFSDSTSSGRCDKKFCMYEMWLIYYPWSQATLQKITGYLW